MALPRDACRANDFRHLTPSLGSSPPIEKQGVFGTSPKPAPAVKNETAARLGEAGGGENEVKAGNFQAQGYVGAGFSAIAKLPSRATLARKWPKLHINRLTWRWRDDASGAWGDDFESLLVFLGERAR